jgi:hypothetical protein
MGVLHGNIFLSVYVCSSQSAMIFFCLADELMFIFGEPLNIADELHYTHDEILISERLMSYWSNFAKYGLRN